MKVQRQTIQLLVAVLVLGADHLPLAGGSPLLPRTRTTPPIFAQRTQVPSLPKTSASPQTSPSVPSPSAKPRRGRCVSVLDGDTLLVLCGENVISVHLFATGAPDKAQPYGRAAKATLWELAFGQTLTIYPTPIETQSERPEENRPLASWVFAGKTCLNTKMVQLGMSWWDKLHAPDQSKMSGIEARARADQVGLWKDKAPLAPWLWRASQPENQVERPLENLPDTP